MPAFTKPSFLVEFCQIYAVNFSTPKRCNRSHFYECKRTLTTHYTVGKYIFFMFLAVFFISGCAGQKLTHSPLFGPWESQLEPKVVLTLNPKSACTLEIIKNPLLPSPKKDCEFEIRERRIDVYLKNAQGECGNLPDFELIYQADSDSLTLLLPPNNIELFRAYSK